MGYVDENIVLDFYLSQMEQDNVKFLKGREDYKTHITGNITKLKSASTMHDKIEASKSLWKLLFESAMSYIDPDKRGYDALFAYFDEYVNFEELIFASDSFYRDHTLHCLWVYFLGEYVSRHEEFAFMKKDIFGEIDAIVRLGTAIEESSLEREFESVHEIAGRIRHLYDYDDSIRCLTALTHDLGYPLKKIHKISKCIGKVLPYFAIHHYDEFNFSFGGIQENFIKGFLDLLKLDFSINMSAGESENEEKILIRKLLDELFITDKATMHIIGINREKAKVLTEKEKNLLRFGLKPKLGIREDVVQYMQYCSDFEEYKHGIMSAFLLVKTLDAFTGSRLTYVDKSDLNLKHIEFTGLTAKTAILKAVTDHTCDGFQIEKISTPSAFLTLMDELEEFSRISRANQNRQYVIEFCKTELCGKDGILQVDFIFDNENIVDLDPERTFKDKCKRFLSLFNISRLDEDLRIKLQCISKLPQDNNTYTLEIGCKYADISINGVSQNIPKYLKSRQFYTVEEYQRL